MRGTIAAILGLAVLVTTSALAISNPAHPQRRSLETPAENVRRSERYDNLLSTNAHFRAYRMRKECGPIRDPELHHSCLTSFDVYEPFRSGAKRVRHHGSHLHRAHQSAKHRHSQSR
jgi:hypothetical protein